MPTAPVTAIIFDKDGTLFDFQATWSVWAYRVIDALGDGNPDREDRLADALAFDRESGLFRPESTVIASTSAVTAAHVHAEVGGDASSMAARMNEIGEAIPQAQVPGVHNALDRLSQTLTLGIATNDAEASARRHLETTDMARFFDFVAGSDSGWGGKPAPGQLMAFAEQTGHAPATTLMVGDSTHDLLAGKAAGMRRVAVLTGVAKTEELAPFADVVLPDITHLANWIESETAT